MIVKSYIREFENLGFGMFVHFGLYSVLGKGEWAKNILHISDETYESLAEKFHPESDWAKQLVTTAKQAGCKYITLTTRHHDGFSLFDTCGLSSYDTIHTACGRDLVREFVDACREQDMIPFFYHTLLDWHEKSYQEDFPKYLKYLRSSVELLCKNYGKIGGLWFDGMWDKPNEDWEEDALYGLIRSYQPEAMIINNTGLSARGALGHIELDSVTFERGKPQPLNLEDSPKYIASEMCEIFADHWGYAADDFNFKSPALLIEEVADCRKYGSNMLINVGPMENGRLRSLDTAILELIGEWVRLHGEAIRLPRPSGISIENKKDDFLLVHENHYYLFCYHLPMSADINVAEHREADFTDVFKLPKKISSVNWLDNNEPVKFSQKGNDVTIHTVPYSYGRNLVVRIAKITCEQ